MAEAKILGFLDHETRLALSHTPSRATQRGPHWLRSQDDSLTRNDSSLQEEVLFSIQIYVPGGSPRQDEPLSFNMLDRLYDISKAVEGSLLRCNFLEQLPEPYTGFTLELYHGFYNKIVRCVFQPFTKGIETDIDSANYAPFHRRT